MLLVLDEAQNVGSAMLEELRLLSNLNDGRRRSLQILLSGQPALRDLLKGPDGTVSPNASQWSMHWSRWPREESHRVHRSSRTMGRRAETAVFHASLSERSLR